jgi:HYR domain/Carboxypeptidase regulatory-like domain
MKRFKRLLKIGSAPNDGPDQATRSSHRQAFSSSKKTVAKFFALGILVSSILILVPTVFLFGGAPQKQTVGVGVGAGKPTGLRPTFSQAVAFVETPAVRDLPVEALTPEQASKIAQEHEKVEKNIENKERVKPLPDPKMNGPFIDPAINNFKHPDNQPSVVTNPLVNFDGPDADTGAPLFGTRFAPPDTNAAVGPNHVVVVTNMGVTMYDKSGNVVKAQFRLSQLLVGIPNAGADNGDPVALYDQLADRWILSQFNLTVTNGSTHQHIAVSKTGDPTGAYFAYDFLMTQNRPADYPHMGVWHDGYYMATNDFSLPVFSGPFQGAGLYAFERAKMLVGDPAAKIIAFNTNNQHGGMLPSNLQGFTPAPAGTPNLFFEFDADEFGAACDLVRPFAFHADFNTPANSTLTQGTDICTSAFDARTNRMQQPAPGENLDGLNDRLMHALNFRVLPGGVQSITLNFTVNVSGSNPTSVALYQGGVRWLELRRNVGTGAVTINQDATYAPGSGNGTGRDLWMSAITQDGEGNIGLAASASAPGPTPPALNPTAIYTGRLTSDPANTLPQGEVDALSAVTRGVQTSTVNRWGDYSSLFIDPADDCTFWGAFEYVDSPTASFDWNTRVFSFKVNPACVTSARGTINGTITNCGNGQPVQNAVITTPDGFIRQSSATGQFSMIVPPGTYTVTVSGPPGSGFGTCTQQVTVAANGTATVNCCLQAAAIIVSAGATLVSESCAPANGVLDPNETVTISFCVQNTGGASTTALTGTLQATGGVTAPSGPQNYGVVVAGGPPVCRNFTFTVSGTCGGTVTATIHFVDGATDLGNVTYTFTLGVQATALQENFDGVTAPALPAGWTTSFTNGDGDCTVGGPLCTLGSNWTTVSTTSDTAPNSAFHNDASCVTDNVLDTPAINITSNAAQLTFRNSFNTESTFDGGVLEISSPNINGGAFTDIITAGGSFVGGGYNGTISVNFLSPIAGRQAWTGNSGGFITTTVKLPAVTQGQTIKLRFRMASDCSVSATGWNVDTIKVSDGLTCCQSAGNPCVITCPANITKSNDPNQCGAVVTYPAPTSTGDCGTITCSPASGSFFPVGTTTVTCQAANGGGTAPVGSGINVPANPTGSASKSVGLGGPIVGRKPATSFRRAGQPGAVSFPKASLALLYDQTDNPSAAATSSQNFEASFDPFDDAVADDFIVPAGEIWTINQVNVSGVYFNGAGPANSVNVTFYPDAATLPGSAEYTASNLAVVDTAGNFVINLTTPAMIPAGTHWVSVQANMDFGVGGQWGWLDRTTISNSGAAWINPGGGFGAGCSPNFGRKTTCVAGSDPDNIFQLLGTSAPAGGGNGPTCTFTITVNDTQAPVITCPANITVATANVNSPCQVVTFAPTASDNCPGVTVVCTPASGTCFPVGVTTVSCTATDASNNTASCSFTVSVFNGRLEDDAEGCNNSVLFNTLTGDYRWCCHGTVFTGKGKVTRSGNTYTLQHNPADRRVLITLNAGASTPNGNGSLQSPPGTLRCTIADRDIRNDTCLCGAAPPPTSPNQ